MCKKTKDVRNSILPVWQIFFLKNVLDALPEKTVGGCMRVSTKGSGGQGVVLQALVMGVAMAH